MTVSRLRNELRCRWSYLVSLTGRQWYHHLPTFVSLEPANYCMLRCPQCPVGQRGAADGERHWMTLDLCKRVIDQVAKTAHTIIFHFQGEPLLNPELPNMIRYAHARRMYTMLSTNAQTLSPELAVALAEAGLDQIIISVDGLTQESYEHYRVGGKLERALEGMRAMSSLPNDSRPEIVMQCLYLKSNEHEWRVFEERYKELGADRLEMKTAQFYDFEMGNPDMPTDSRYSRYVEEGGRYRLKKKLHNRCYRLWSGCVVTTEGWVLPCCFDKDHSFAFGNIMTDSLPAILASEHAVRFRDHVLHGRADVSICRNCSE